MDQACPAVLARLQRGPATTIELQATIRTTHVAKPIFDLRKAGYRITTKRLSNGVARYTLEPGVPEGVEATPPVSAPSRVPAFGDMNLIRTMRRR